MYHKNQQVQATGGEWKRELLFSVPLDHPEVERLQGRYKKWVGLPCMHANKNLTLY